MSKIRIPAEYKAFEDKFSALAYGQDGSKVFDFLKYNHNCISVYYIMLGTNMAIL